MGIIKNDRKQFETFDVTVRRSCALLWGARRRLRRSADRRVARVDERRVQYAADAEGRRHADPEGYYRRRCHAPDVPYSFRYGGDGRVVHV